MLSRFGSWEDVSSMCDFLEAEEVGRFGGVTIQ
jgi:hypothetical protein